MVSALYATLTYDLVRWLEYATSAITAHMKAVVLSVEDREYLMLIIARSVLYKRKIGMVAQKLQIWGPQRLTCFMSGRSMALINDELQVLKNIKHGQTQLHEAHGGIVERLLNLSLRQFKQ
eukprot:TRINITY_DN14783_c0_g1_i4.p5 TRINITY_DN14783_c0_g1~~TRINITY_DN14783_c0_g1_i4.p5  ORF type:complete len:121 (-),score=3.39 TRINITY_DN14783_c0_g1_i4:383-745(-)